MDYGALKEMSKPRRYKSPPVEEAVCEFRFLPSVEAKATPKYYARLHNSQISPAILHLKPSQSRMGWTIQLKTSLRRHCCQRKNHEWFRVVAGFLFGRSAPKLRGFSFALSRTSSQPVARPHGERTSCIAHWIWMMLRSEMPRSRQRNIGVARTFGMHSRSTTSHCSGFETTLGTL